MVDALKRAMTDWVRGQQNKAIRTYNRLYPGPDKSRAIYYFHQLTGVGYNDQGN